MMGESSFGMLDERGKWDMNERTEVMMLYQLD